MGDRITIKICIESGSESDDDNYGIIPAPRLFRPPSPEQAPEDRGECSSKRAKLEPNGEPTSGQGGAQQGDAAAAQQGAAAVAAAAPQVEAAQQEQVSESPQSPPANVEQHNVDPSTPERVVSGEFIRLFSDQPSGPRDPRLRRQQIIHNGMPLYSMSIPVIVDASTNPPRLIQAGEGPRADRSQIVHRGRFPSTQREIWIRQQLEMENRRRSLASTSGPLQRHRLLLTHYLDPEALIHMIQLHHRRALLHNENVGVPSDLIERLTTLYKYVAYPAPVDAAAQISCVICMSNFEIDQDIRRLPCLHIFHKVCVDTWLVTNQRCPICRSKIDSTPEEFEIFRSARHFVLRRRQ